MSHSIRLHAHFIDLKKVQRVLDYDAELLLTQKTACEMMMHTAETKGGVFLTSNLSSDA